MASVRWSSGAACIALNSTITPTSFEIFVKRVDARGTKRKKQAIFGRIASDNLDWNADIILFVIRYANSPLTRAPSCRENSSWITYMPDLTIKKKPRPIWFNLSPVNLPVPGLVSIFHRISGIILVLALIWVLYLLELSLDSELGFSHVREYMSHPTAKLAMLGLLWAFLHHFCAGIRYLFLDIHLGIDLPTARMTSFLVFAVSLVLTVILGVRLW